jgi:succinate dehydrogenase / fumarate reductase cytochrome b subunit
MSKSAILSSSLAKKYWMALTGLFLCLFLVGHLLGNLQLILIDGEDGQRAFNEYAYFMTHNPFIKVLSYVTYISILFHAIDGILLAIQNKKARPVNYQYTNPSANSKLPARQMAVLGSAILIFIVIHMANFWWKMKYSSKQMPLHTYVVYPPQTGTPTGDTLYYTTSGIQLPKSPQFEIREGNKIFISDEWLQNEIAAAKMQGQQVDDKMFENKDKNVEIAEGYKDLHSLVFAFFGHDRAEEGFETNSMPEVALILYVLAMVVLSFHLMHGFSSAFQSLGINHRKYTPYIKKFGTAFSILVPLGFAIIPIVIYLTK